MTCLLNGEVNSFFVHFDWCLQPYTVKASRKHQEAMHNAWHLSLYLRSLALLCLANNPGLIKGIVCVLD